MNLNLLTQLATYASPYSSSLSKGYKFEATESAFSMVNPVWLIVALVLAIVGGFLVYFLFVKSKQEQKGFLAKLRDFCSFKTLMVESALKILYLISAIFITLMALGMISGSFLGFLVTLIVGNIALRIGYELILLGIMTYSNIVEINSKIKK